MDTLDERADTLPQHDCKVLSLADVQPQNVKWLWPDRIPLGMYSLMAGQPGVGKTTISHSIAAIVSNGGQWPFSEHRAEQGHVIILTAEDDPKYTLVPRLMAANADLNYISMIQSVARLQNDEQVVDAQLLLSKDMHQLHGVLDQFPNTRLLIFDPLSAYLGINDSHNDANVRQVLGPLTELAAQHEVAILGITHLSKNEKASAMARFMGSTGIVAAARTAYLAAKHEDEILWLPVKSNVARGDIGGLSYRIVSATVCEDIETSAVEWTGQTDVDADDVLSQSQASRNSTKLDEAMDFLEEQLRDGGKREPDIKESSEEEGHSWTTVKRAKKELGLVSDKTRFTGGWKWYTKDQYLLKKSQEPGEVGTLRENQETQGQEFDTLGGKDTYQGTQKLNNTNGFREDYQEGQASSGIGQPVDPQSAKSTKSGHPVRLDETKVIL
jgi:putative DNA primase/helicase